MQRFKGKRCTARMFKNGENKTGLAVECGFAGQVERPDEITGYYPGLRVLDLSPEDGDLIEMLRNRIRNVTLADCHASRTFKTPVEAVRDFSTTTMRHERRTSR